jgi:hypothetical protein
MRNVVSLGLLALSMGFIANPALAGNVEDCEPLKQSGQKSLYGLCVAWHNADEDAKDAIAEKFYERTGYSYRVPGSETREPDPEPDPVVCPCTDGVDTSAWGMKVGCSSDGSGGDMGMFVRIEDNFTTMFMTMVESGLYLCSISQSPAFYLQLEINLDEYNVCLTELQTRCQ